MVFNFACAFAPWADAKFDTYAQEKNQRVLFISDYTSNFNSN